MSSPKWPLLGHGVEADTAEAILDQLGDPMGDEMGVTNVNWFLTATTVDTIDRADGYVHAVPGYQVHPHVARCCVVLAPGW